MQLDSLFGDSHGDALQITSLEPCEEIPKPAFKKWHDTTHEEQPDAPTRSSEANLTNGTYIEVIVDKVVQIFCHSDLSHELVLVTVHACKGINVCKDILKGVSG